MRGGQLTPLAVPQRFIGWVCAAVVDGLAWPEGGVGPAVALSIHAPGRNYSRAVGAILDFAIVAAAGRPLILAGDFNVAVGLRQPGQRLANTADERVLLGRLREELGLLPCWQTAHPGELLARTLRWLRRADSLPYHCDGFFVPASWAAAIESCTVLEGADWNVRSDHNPVVAKLALDCH